MCRCGGRKPVRRGQGRRPLPVCRAVGGAPVRPPPAPTMNAPALKLRQYCTDAGLSPLASEWWHFNDLEANAAIGSRYMTTAFQVADCLTAACP